MKRHGHNSGALFLISPYVLFTLVIWIIPFIWGLWIALRKWNIISPQTEFVGVANFIKLFHDPLFYISLKNTLRFMVVFIPLVVLLSLLVALMLQRIKTLQAFFASGYLISYVSAGVAYSVVFKILFSGEGPINNWLRSFGLEIPWFSSPALAMFTIALMVTWKFLGYYALIFLAGLQAIPHSLYESAELEGAGAWSRFWHITLPLLNPSLVVVLVFAVMLSFNLFTEPYIITGGGPLDSTQTPVMQIYYHTFETLHAGYGSGFAIVIAVISFILVYGLKGVIEKDIAYT